MQFFQGFDELCEVGDGLAELQDMPGAGVGSFEQVRLDELRDEVFIILVFELLEEGDEVGGLDEFFADPEAVLI